MIEYPRNNEEVESNYPGIIHTVSEIRQYLGLKEPNSRCLRAISSSPETIDIDNLTSLSPGGRNKVLNNLIGVQLTHGCRGGCPDCIFGRKNGVTSQFSQQAVVALVTELNRTGNQIHSLFFDSDPLDWRVDGYSVVDVIADLDTPPEYLATATPPGSYSAFESLLTYMFVNQTSFPLTLSLWPHNIRRVESSLISTYQHMLDTGIPKTEVDDFFGTNGSINFSLRLEHEELFEISKTIELSSASIFGHGFMNAGEARLGKRDCIKWPSAPAYDGILLTPGSQQIQAVIASPVSAHTPSGFRRFPLCGEQGPIPQRFTAMDQRSPSGNCLLDCIPPSLRDIDGNSFLTGDDIIDTMIHIERMAMRLHQATYTLALTKHIFTSANICVAFNSAFDTILANDGLPLEQLLTKLDAYIEADGTCESTRQQLDHARSLIDVHFALSEQIYNLCSTDKIDVTGATATARGFYFAS